MPFNLDEFEKQCAEADTYGNAMRRVQKAWDELKDNIHKEFVALLERLGLKS